ncbi:unnamed protein product, partial [Menidia menidia]
PSHSQPTAPADYHGALDRNDPTIRRRTEAEMAELGAGSLPLGDPAFNYQEHELSERLKRLYPAVNEEETPLPRSWSPKDKYSYIGLSQNNLRVHYKAEDGCPSTVPSGGLEVFPLVAWRSSLWAEKLLGGAARSGMSCITGTRAAVHVRGAHAGLEVSADGQLQGHGKNHKDAASVRATHPIPAACGIYYFEVKIVSKGRDG